MKFHASLIFDHIDYDWLIYAHLVFNACAVLSLCLFLIELSLRFSDMVVGRGWPLCVRFWSSFCSSQ
uniref:Uncharacterized protein n=1 Tax=Physcomitrium patens TaxID=3218 RepID=A0A7I4ETT3_PHYPA